MLSWCFYKLLNKTSVCKLIIIISKVWKLKLVTLILKYSTGCLHSHHWRGILTTSEQCCAKEESIIHESELHLVRHTINFTLSYELTQCSKVFVISCPDTINLHLQTIINTSSMKCNKQDDVFFLSVSVTWCPAELTWITQGSSQTVPVLTLPVFFKTLNGVLSI